MKIIQSIKCFFGKHKTHMEQYSHVFSMKNGGYVSVIITVNECDCGFITEPIPAHVSTQYTPKITKEYKDEDCGC